MDLERLIGAEGPMRPERAVGWALRLAKTLQRMHRRGLIHGAVCARAIEMDGAETFQPARLLDEHEVDDAPQYHSAPRAEGAPPSGADDVWAAGVVLYYSVTGALPFPGATDADVLARIEWLPPSPIAEHGCHADDVQDVLERVLSKKRDDPITTAGQLRQALAACRGGSFRVGPLDVSEQIILRLASLPNAGQDAIAEWLMDDEEATHDILDEPSSDELIPAPASSPHGSSKPGEDVPAPDLVAPALGVTHPRRDGAPSERPPHRRPAGVPPAPRGRSTGIVIGAVALLAVAAALYVLFFRSDEQPAMDAPAVQAPAKPTRTPAPPAPTRAASPAATAPRSAPSPSAATSGGPPVARATTSARSPAEASARPRAKLSDAQVDRCVIGLFPADTFSTRQPRFEFLCRETNPAEGCVALRSRIVWAGTGRPMTGGMKEWSQLLWYDMATYGIIRARCCADAPALKVAGITPDLATCGLQEALTNLMRVVIEGSADEVEAAVAGYTKSVRCLSGVGASKHFGYPGGLTGGEITYFNQFLERVRGTGI